MESNILLPIGLIIPAEFHPAKLLHHWVMNGNLMNFTTFEETCNFSHDLTEVSYYIFA